MVITRELKGSKDDILQQIQSTPGQILSAFLVVDSPNPETEKPTDAEFAQMMRELDSLAIHSGGHADVSREAMYTRMPGE